MRTLVYFRSHLFPSYSVLYIRGRVSYIVWFALKIAFSKDSKIEAQETRGPSSLTLSLAQLSEVRVDRILIGELKKIIKINSWLKCVF